MNTTLAIILTIVVTNWTHIGDFKDASGKSFDVQEGRIQTNTVVDVSWWDRKQVVPTNMHLLEGVTMYEEELHTNRFVLKSAPGPIVDRRLVEMTNYHIIIGSNYLQNPLWIIPTNTTTWLTNQNVIAQSKTNVEQSELDKLLWMIWTGQTNLWLTNKEYVATNIWLFNHRGKKTHAIPAIKLED